MSHSATQTYVKKTPTPLSVPARRPTPASDLAPAQRVDVAVVGAGLGHDFARLPLHAPAMEACPLQLSTPRACPFGGACHTCPASAVQAKLRVGQPDDEYEREADRVAEQVMSMPQPTVQRQEAPCAECEDEEQIQTKPLADSITPLVQRETGPENEDGEASVQTRRSGGLAPPIDAGLEMQIRALRGGGQPLPETARAFFEPRFGHDFSRVRVHADVQAAESARALNAQAYTVGRDVVFGAGQYAPATADGRRLLAHELTHVVQQTAVPHPIMQKAPPPAPPVLPYDPTYGPSAAHCDIYHSPLARLWFTSSYRHNAYCACTRTPNDPHNNCVRKCLQVRMLAHLARLSRMGAALPFTFPGEADPLCRDMWRQHVDCYRDCGCRHAFINYPTFSVMCRAPFPCWVVEKSISWFNACM